MANTRVTVRICGATYQVSSDQPAAYVQELAHRVDTEMSDLLEAHRSVSPYQAAVLTALSATERAAGAEATADHLRGQLQTYLEENNRLREALARARK